MMGFAVYERGKSAPTNLLGELDGGDGEQVVAEHLGAAVLREAPGPHRRALARLGHGARGEQRHVAVDGRLGGGGGGGGELREAIGERLGGDAVDEVRAREGEHVAEHGERGRRLPRLRGLVGDRRQRVGQHGLPGLLGRLHEIEDTRVTCTSFRYRRTAPRRAAPPAAAGARARGWWSSGGEADGSLAIGLRPAGSREEVGWLVWVGYSGGAAARARAYITAVGGERERGRRTRTPTRAGCPGPIPITAQGGGGVASPAAPCPATPHEPDPNPRARDAAVPRNPSRRGFCAGWLALAVAAPPRWLVRV